MFGLQCWAEIEKLRKQFACVEKTQYTQEDVKAEGWDRDTDARVVVVGAAQMVGREETYAKICEH